MNSLIQKIQLISRNGKSLVFIFSKLLLCVKYKSCKSENVLI